MRNAFIWLQNFAEIVHYKIAFICKLREDYGKKIRQAILMASLDGVKSPYFKKDELHADK